MQPAILPLTRPYGMKKIQKFSGGNESKQWYTYYHNRRLKSIFEGRRNENI